MAHRATIDELRLMTSMNHFDVSMNDSFKQPIALMNAFGSCAPIGNCVRHAPRRACDQWTGQMDRAWSPASRGARERPRRDVPAGRTAATRRRTSARRAVVAPPFSFVAGRLVIRETAGNSDHRQLWSTHFDIVRRHLP